MVVKRKNTLLAPSVRGVAKSNVSRFDREVPKSGGRVCKAVGFSLYPVPVYRSSEVDGLAFSVSAVPCGGREEPHRGQVLLNLSELGGF